MSNRMSRRDYVQKREPSLVNNAWVWTNWVKNGYRKASEITFDAYCKTEKIKTEYGDIFCLTDRSPIVVRKMRRLIESLYKMSNETPPIFVDRHIFKRIQAVEHG